LLIADLLREWRLRERRFECARYKPAARLPCATMAESQVDLRGVTAVDYGTVAAASPRSWRAFRDFGSANLTGCARGSGQA
jgi:hypothetical protein